MNISSSSLATTSSMMMQQFQKSAPPGASELSNEVIATNDIDNDSLLSISETNLSEDAFSSMDGDGDGSLSSNELESSFAEMLEGMKNQTTTPEEFSELLTNMGLEVPALPQQNTGMQNVSQMANDIFTQNDTNEDGLLSVDELDISEDLLSSMDLDDDGNITQEELAQGLQTLFDNVESGEMSQEEVGDELTSLGVPPPESGAGGQGAGGGQGASGESSSTEEYDEADLNEDGIVTDAEQAQYDGVSTDDMSNYTMTLVSTLMDALKSELDSSDDIELSQFKSIMSMVNNEIQDNSTAQKLNTYVSNLDLGLKSA